MFTKMKLLLCVWIFGLVCATTPSTTATAGTTTNPAMTGSTTQQLTSVIESTNKPSSLTTAEKDISPQNSTTSPLSTTTPNSSSSYKNIDNSLALENEILGITGTHDAVNLEVKTIAEPHASGLSVTQDGGNGAEKPLINSNDSGAIDSAKTNPNSSKVSDVDRTVSDKLNEAISANEPNIIGYESEGTVETSNAIKISTKEANVVDLSMVDSNNNLLNPTVNSMIDTKGVEVDITNGLHVQDPSINEIKAKDQSITVKTGSGFNDIGHTNTIADKINGNIPEKIVEENKLTNSVVKPPSEVHKQKNEPMVKEEVALNKVLVTGDINLPVDVIKSNKKKNCNVKNRECVPTREELVAAGVDNADMMQHRVDLEPPKIIKDMPSDNKNAKANAGTLSEKKKCNIKNKECVPTRAELVDAGVDNVDIMQHSIDPKPPTDLNKPSNSIQLDVKANNAGTGCNVKIGTCLPSEKEVIAAGVDMSVPMQFSIDTESAFLGLSKNKDSEVVKENSTVAQNNVDTTSTEHATENSMTSGYEKTNKKGTPVSIKSSGDELTKVAPPATVQQIPEPSSTTQQTKSTEMTSTTVQTTQMTTEFKKCPKIACIDTCAFGRKVNANGCETCECKFSNNCPRVTPVSRLLCLLRANTSLSCSSDADCRRNRMCCPGTCGPICRRATSGRSMLLSMLVE